MNVLGMCACTRVHSKLSCTRLQNYTIGASPLCIRISSKYRGIHDIAAFAVRASPEETTPIDDDVVIDGFNESCNSPSTSYK